MATPSLLMPSGASEPPHSSEMLQEQTEESEPELDGSSCSN